MDAIVCLKQSLTKHVGYPLQVGNVKKASQTASTDSEKKIEWGIPTYRARMGGQRVTFPCQRHDIHTHTLPQHHAKQRPHHGGLLLARNNG